MLTKLFLALLAISIVITGFFTFYAWTWVQSIASPASAVEGYNFHAHIAWIFLCISSLLLFLLANVILAKDFKSVPLWITFGFFSVFTLTNYIWLDRSASARFTDEMLGRSTAFGTFVGVFLCLAAAVVVYADQFALVRLRKKIYADPATPDETKPETPPADSEE